MLLEGDVAIGWEDNHYWLWTEVAEVELLRKASAFLQKQG
ncbi:hypothetical protein NC651_007026 [Populus alba x Populus x berolinensis]|nr:hypothetical protein NC651_007026 [Populus alba x Populus x berolinensis]